MKKKVTLKGTVSGSFNLIARYLIQAIYYTMTRVLQGRGDGGKGRKGRGTGGSEGLEGEVSDRKE